MTVAEDDRAGVSNGPNGRPLNSTVAETGPGLPDDAVAPGQLAPGELDAAGADAAVRRLRETGWATPPAHEAEAGPAAADADAAEAETEAHPT